MTTSITSKWGCTIIVDDEDADLLPNRCKLKNPKSYIPAKGGGNMGRIVLSRKLGRELLKSERADHKNLNKLDNRRENVRLATQQQNCVNVDKKRHTQSPYKGICRESRVKWVAQITIDRKPHRLGLFADPLEAHRTWCIASLKRWGEFANFGSNSPFVGWTLQELERGYQIPVQLELPLVA